MSENDIKTYFIGHRHTYLHDICLFF